jgi:hypothetical protein
MTGETRPRVLFILGAGHCGSTLLSMLLNGHPACVAVSELSLLHSSLAAGDSVLDRPEWQTARRAFEAKAGMRLEQLSLLHPSWRTFATWSDTQVLAWARPRATLMSCLAEATGRSWIVDGSKSWQQLYLMHRSGLFDLRVVHLIRDARGVVHAYKRKYGGVRHGLSKWLKASAAAFALAPQLRDHWLRVQYEQLASDPSATLTKICGLMGLVYDPAMLRFRDHAWLGIGGNRMAKSTDTIIRLDEKWRREMSRRDRLIVDLVSGPVNRYYGY